MNNFYATDTWYKKSSEKEEGISEICAGDYKLNKSVWKNSSDIIPPIGKRILVEKNSIIFSATLHYAWKFDDHNCFGTAITKEELQNDDFKWTEIPE